MQPDDGRVVSNFIIQALTGKDITIYGDGSQTRSFCYVDDLVSGILSYLKTEKNLTGPVNLGNPDEFTMLELAEMVIELTNSSSKIVFQPLPSDDPQRRKPQIDLAKSLLEWQPKIALETGLKRTIEYFKTLNLN
jgi:UDP-glucuronate decarboxylase